MRGDAIDSRKDLKHRRTSADHVMKLVCLDKFAVQLQRQSPPLCLLDQLPKPLP